MDERGVNTRAPCLSSQEVTRTFLEECRRLPGVMIRTILLGQTVQTAAVGADWEKDAADSPSGVSRERKMWFKPLAPDFTTECRHRRNNVVCQRRPA